MPLTLPSFHSMQYQQDIFCLSPSDSAMTENDFFKIRPYHNTKKQMPVLAKSRRGMRPMRSSTTSTAAQKNKKLRYYSTLSDSKPAITMSYSFHPQGPKKGKCLIDLIYCCYSPFLYRFYQSITIWNCFSNHLTSGPCWSMPSFYCISCLVLCFSI